MPGEQLVELRPVTLGDARRMGDIAGGCLQQANQIIAFEIAPGVDLEKDILGQMGFKPVIAEDLKVMNEGMFRENWGELKNIVMANGK